MQHMVSLLQLGVLRSMRAGSELHSCAVQLTTSVHAPQDT